LSTNLAFTSALDFVHYLDFYAYQFLDQVADSNGYETHSFRWNWWLGMVSVLREKILPDSGGYVVKHGNNTSEIEARSKRIDSNLDGGCRR
jgi:hypothetical protein